MIRMPYFARNALRLVLRTQPRTGGIITMRKAMRQRTKGAQHWPSASIPSLTTVPNQIVAEKP